MVSFGNDELVPQFIYCGDFYFIAKRMEKFRKMLLTKVKKYAIESSMLTMLLMQRYNLITKEKAKEASEGKLKNDYYWEDQELSVNDDLDIFLTNLSNTKEIKGEWAGSFFTPKLTNEELKLVEVKNEDHLKTYMAHSAGLNPDVHPEEMKKSDSKSKYVHVKCCRLIIPLTLEKNKTKAVKKYCTII